MSAGMLDPTFNPAGSPPGFASAVKQAAFGYGAVVQPSGKIVVVGQSAASSGNAYQVVTLAEFDPNGSLDTQFGAKGFVTTSKWAVPSSISGVTAVLYPTGGSGDQQILVVGTSTSSALTLARYNSDGSLDTSFGSKGMVNTSFTQGTGRLDAGVVLVPNGTSPPKILVAGSDANNAGIEMARYNPNGSLDTSFGSGGKIYTPVSGGFQLSAFASDPVSGDLIAAGDGHVSGYAGALVAFHSNGSLDSSFGTNGVVSAGGGTAFLGPPLAIYPTTDPNGNAGKILIGDTRVSVTGALDTTWAAGTFFACGLAIQSDGKVLAGNNDWQLARLDADGSLDGSFGSGGVTGVAGGPYGGGAGQLAVVLEPNGDILQAGGGYVSNGRGGDTNAFAVARYLPSEPEIGSFSASQVSAGGPVNLTASNISDGNPNSTISQVTFFYYDSSGNKIVIGTVTSPDGSGNWTLNASLPPGSYTLYAQAIDSYSVLGDPLAYSLTVQ